MLGRPRYTPVLRWKPAEARALRELYLFGTETKFLTPLIELIPPRANKKGIVPRIEDVLLKGINDIFDNWGEEPIFIDSHLLNPNLTTKDGLLPLQFLKDNSFRKNLQLIPVTGLKRTPSHDTVVAAMIKDGKLGACIRLTLEDIALSDFSNQLSRLLNRLQVSPGEIDLIIDYKMVDGGKSSTFETILRKIPEIRNWRSLIYLAGAFPKDLTSFSVGEHTLDRTDWLFWYNQMSSTTNLPRFPSYGDYTIQHPTYEMIPTNPNPSASIRYTSSEYWVIMRGAGVLQQGRKQWPANALSLMEREEFSGSDYSFGDKYIYEMGLQLKQTGNIERVGSPTTWLQAGINHHITFVLDQLNKTFVPSIAVEP
jgi:hypothetical protein